MAEAMASDPVNRELFESVTDRILEHLRMFELKFDRLVAKNEMIDRDLNHMNVTIAKQNVDDLQEQVKEQGKKIESLEIFKTKILTGLIVANILVYAVFSIAQIYFKSR